MKKEYYCADCNTPLKKRDKSCPKCGSKHIKIRVELHDKVTV